MSASCWCTSAEPVALRTASMVRWLLYLAKSWLANGAAFPASWCASDCSSELVYKSTLPDAAKRDPAKTANRISDLIKIPSPYSVSEESGGKLRASRKALSWRISGDRDRVRAPDGFRDAPRAVRHSAARAHRDSHTRGGFARFSPKDDLQ